MRPVKSIRNNNAGNIKDFGIDWRGRDKNYSGDFVRFLSPVWGFRALAKLLINYQEKHNLNTIAEIMSRYAPDTENPTNSYIEYIEKKLGHDKNDYLLVRPNLPIILDAIGRFETGPTYDSYFNNEQIQEALKLI